MVNKTNSCVFISGNGTNLRSLIKSSRDYNFPIKIKLIISDNVNAKGLRFAKQYSIPYKFFPSENKEKFERNSLFEIKKNKIKFLCLAGFMKILSNNFIKSFGYKIINIHPSLLPDYPGLNTHARALQAGDSEAGCTVHWVSEGVDEGDIIRQARVPVKSGDTPATLANRVLEAEHRLYPQALAEACRYIIARQAS